jgi:nickel/cobalt transporter (NicO) family protein
MQKKHRLLGMLSSLLTLVIWLLTATPSQAHWADMAAAEVTVKETAIEMRLTFPTGLVAFADGDRNQQLSADEINIHRTELTDFFNQKIQLTNAEKTAGEIFLQPLSEDNLPTMVQVAPTTHSTVQLNYQWSKPIGGLKIHYSMFLPGIQTAHCLMTILQAGQLKTFMFTPSHQTFSLLPSGALNGGVVAIAAAFLWGAMHSLTPGHGKTLVGAYLMGERATPRHALILALTTTVTHTIGVFALGGVALFAAKYVVPEQLYPWLSLLSGGMVVAIGVKLFWGRMKGEGGHHHPDHSHHHHHGHSHHHHHHHEHHHEHHHHYPQIKTRLGSLSLLGIAGGVVPCPAALVLMLGAIAAGQTGTGLLLVVAFSLGLAGVLTGLGLLLVYAKRVFKDIPSSPRFIKILPALSAIAITLIGTGISTQALIQVLGLYGG